MAVTIRAPYSTILLNAAKQAQDDEMLGLDMLLNNCIRNRVNNVYAACEDERPRIAAAARAIMTHHLRASAGLSRV